MSHRLIVLPDDTADAIIDPINAARHTLNIRMFLFTDPILLNAVIAARSDAASTFASCSTRHGATAPATTTSRAKGAARRRRRVRDSSNEFAVTHQKSMVIDDKIGFIESLNWEPRDLTETRDYAVENDRQGSRSRKWCDASMPTGTERPFEPKRPAPN